MKKIICLFLTFISLSNQAYTAKLDYKKYTLDNGMDVYVLPNDRVSAVNHMVIYKVGSIDEPVGKSGIAHFFEHVMFKGTTKYPKNSFSKEVYFAGGDFNAFTDYDLTAYFTNVPADNLEKMMDLEADRMQNIVFAEEDILPERDVVMEERRMRVDNFPHQQLDEQKTAALYLNSQYHTSVIGWMHEIALININDLKEFYNKFYAPNNAILVVSGDVDPEAVYKMAKKYYGSIPKKDIPERVILKEPPHVAKRDLIMYSDVATQDYWYKSYLAPSFNSEDKKDIYALQLLSYLLAGSDTSLLYNNLVLENKQAIAVDASYNPILLGSASFDFTILPEPDKIFSIKDKEINEIIRSLKIKNITEQELNRAKNNIKMDFEKMLDGYKNIAYIVTRFLAIGASIEDINNIPQEVDNIKVDDIYRAMDNLFHENNSVTAKLVKKIKK